jgi:hypothetical protein
MLVKFLAIKQIDNRAEKQRLSNTCNSFFHSVESEWAEEICMFKRWQTPEKEALMGFFDSLFAGKKEHPPLDPGSTAAKQIQEFQEPLEKICQQTSDNLELIPTADTAYIFLGNPPKRFAITWIDQNGNIQNFKTLVEERGVPQTRLERLIGNLGNAYRQSKNEARFSSNMGGKTITVTLSDSLAGNLKQVIAEAIQ